MYILDFFILSLSLRQCAGQRGEGGFGRGLFLLINSVYMKMYYRRIYINV